MKKEDIFKLLNQGKRDVYDLKKPKKYTLKSVLYSFTGKAIKKVTEYVTSALKHDLTIEFRPVKPFRKKDLKGVDATTLYETNSVTENDQVQRGTHTLQDKEGLSIIDKGSDDGFVNWFDVDNEVTKRNHVQNTKCTYTDKYGNTTSLDEAYEELKRQSD